MREQKYILKIIIIIVMSAVGTLAAIDFRAMHHLPKFIPGKALSKVGILSDYHAGLKNSNGDSDVYFFDSGKKGATVLIVGGTHPNESAGFMTAVVILENLKIESGRAIIIPMVNQSGFTCTDPMEALPMYFEIKTDKGIRKFPSGSRASNPLDQWPDPLVYTQFPSGQRYSGGESRNLNRCYPGKANGTLTEQVAYSIIQLLKKEKVDIAFDLHEAAPEIPIVKAIVYHAKSEALAMGAILDLEMDGLSYTPELSPPNFHGLSHREWGDNTDVLPLLMETSNPIQGRLRGKTNSDLILNGFCPNYQIAKETGALKIAYDKEGESLESRVGRHINGIVAILNNFNLEYPEKAIIIAGLPTYSDLKKNKIGKYLN